MKKKKRGRPLGSKNKAKKPSVVRWNLEKSTGTRVVKTKARKQPKLLKQSEVNWFFIDCELGDCIQDANRLGKVLKSLAEELKSVKR